MVYEVKCDNCGDILNFGGKDPDEKFAEEDKIPENAIEFDDSVYCRSCVQELVEFGAEEIFERLYELEGDEEEDY